MRTGRIVLTVGAGGLMALAPVMAASAASESRGCQDFGQNVAGLAQNLGPEFGAIASGVASWNPGAFPTVVVHPEQEALCDNEG